MTVYKYKFDFEVGYLIKSPCKECIRKNDFPECAETCEMLDKVQTILAETRLCSRYYDPI